MNISSALEAAAERPTDRWSEAVRGQVLTAEAALTTGEAAAKTGNTPLATAEMAEEMAAALTGEKHIIWYQIQTLTAFLGFPYFQKDQVTSRKIEARENEPFSNTL